MPVTERLLLTERHTQLQRARQSVLITAQDLTEYMVPHMGRYSVYDRDAQQPNYGSVIDETAIHCIDSMVAGMMALRTSPARAWFRFQTPDPSVNKQHASKKWLSVLQQIVQDVCRRSNTYLMLPQMYGEAGVFGTGATITLDDFDTIVHHHTLTMGEYTIALDRRGRPDTLYREFILTVAECVKEFGIEACSRDVQTMWRSGQLGHPVRIIHVIEPRADRDPSRRDSRNMPWKSCYFETAAETDAYLRESGFPRFPCLVPRWQVIGNDAWGIGLGHRALGSVRQLQAEQLAKAKAMEKQADPPVQVPTTLKDRDRDLLPGGIVPYDQTSPHGGVRTAYEVPLRLDFMLADIEDVRRRIAKAFHVDKFEMLSMLDASTQRTAAEILSRREETLTLLGPVTQRLQNELDEPLLTGIVDRVIQLGLLPTPPPELQGMELEIEYIGPLAQALKAVAAQSTDRFTGALGVIAQMKPDALDKFDADAWVDIYSDMWNVDPDLIVAGPKVALLRDARNKALAAKEQAELMATQAKTTRDLATSPVGGNNVLGAIGNALPVDAVRGYGTGGV